MIKNYTQKNNTFTKVTKDNPKDFIEVEVGDSKQEDFYPQTKIKRWDNECNFSVRLDDKEKGQAKITNKDNKVTWDKGNIKIEFYEVEDAHKFVWYLKEKPTTNKVSFTIQSKGVEFFYQPELTQEEIEDGCKRPENVVGSYAVYASEQKTNYVGGKEYKTGKVGHIYRPHLYDSNGLEAWGDLHIENGIYEVTIPQEFLDKAVYPIKSNDTFGYTSEGESKWGIANTLVVNTFTGVVGTVTSMSAYMQGGNSSDKAKLALYNSSKSFLRATDEIDIIVSDADWNTADLTSRLSVTAVTYYLCVLGNIASWNNQIYYDDGGANTESFAPVTYPNFPNPMGSGTSKDYLLSIYATYTAAATDSTITGIQTIQGIQSITL